GDAASGAGRAGPVPGGAQGPASPGQTAPRPAVAPGGSPEGAATQPGPDRRATGGATGAGAPGAGTPREGGTHGTGGTPGVSAPGAPGAGTPSAGSVPGGGGGVLVKPLAYGDAALALPVPRVHPGDANAGFLAGLMAAAPAELITALHAAPTPSVELRLRELRARLEMTELTSAARSLEDLERTEADDWRVVWYRGVVSLATGDFASAALSFDAVYDAFPGEAAPKLALGVCAEVLGQLDNAAEYYRLVWTTDPSYVSAAFGLARVRLAAGDRRGAVRTLESVPEASIHYTAARVAAVRARLRDQATHEPLLDDLTAAAGQVEALRQVGLDAIRRERLSAEVLGTALDWVLSGGPGTASGAAGHQMLLGSALDERGLRSGLERAYRTLARLAQRGEERIELVERANRLRPRTWV
ncbi:tetratricopeptide repeat protein, partial [Streptomyces sp. O3]